MASLDYIGLYLKMEEGEGGETGQTQVCVNVNSAHSLIHSSKSKKGIPCVKSSKREGGRAKPKVEIKSLRLLS